MVFSDLTWPNAILGRRVSEPRGARRTALRASFAGILLEREVKAVWSKYQLGSFLGNRAPERACRARRIGRRVLFNVLSERSRQTARLVRP